MRSEVDGSAIDPSNQKKGKNYITSNVSVSTDKELVLEPMSFLPSKVYIPPCPNGLDCAFGSPVRKGMVVSFRARTPVSVTLINWWIHLVSLYMAALIMQSYTDRI